MKVAVGLLTDFDLFASITTLVGQRRELDFDARDRGDDVVFRDGAFITEAEDVVEIEPGIQLAPGSAGAGGRFCEAYVVISNK